MMITEKIDIVLGDDCMGLYVDGELVCAATKLTFADVLEHLNLRVDFWESDLDVYNDPRQLPKRLEDVVYPEDNPLEVQKEEQA